MTDFLLFRMRLRQFLNYKRHELTKKDHWDYLQEILHQEQIHF